MQSDAFIRSMIALQPSTALDVNLAAAAGDPHRRSTASDRPAGAACVGLPFEERVLDADVGRAAAGLEPGADARVQRDLDVARPGPQGPIPAGTAVDDDPPALR